MYKSTFKIFRTYWIEYGGLVELLCSPFVHAALVLTALYHFGFIDLDWRVTSVGSLPTILGFSLAAYTITFALMGSALHRTLSAKIDKKTGLPLINIVNATFFHVVVFQALGLLYAVSTGGSFAYDLLHRAFEPSRAKHYFSIVYRTSDDLGFFFTVYSVLLLFSVAIAMYRLGRLGPKIDQLHRRAEVANDLARSSPDVSVERSSSVIHTRRFKFVAWLSRRLGLYSGGD